MSRVGAAVVLCCLALGACRIEDHTPRGSRRDDEAIQRLLTEYTRRLAARDWPAVRALFWDEARYEAASAVANVVVPIDSARERLLPASAGGDVRLVRADTRQEGDLATAWLVSRRSDPGAGGAEAEWTEHVILRRIGGEWRILNISLAGGTRRRV